MRQRSSRLDIVSFATLILPHPPATMGDFGLKITATISWFGSQNQAGFGLSVVPQN
jgi:hypothetical protein